MDVRNSAGRHSRACIVKVGVALKLARDMLPPLQNPRSATVDVCVCGCGGAVYTCIAKRSQDNHLYVYIYIYIAIAFS